ncbi:ATP-dependent DNA ligase [Halogranum tailed virus 1]|uniref:DNA ligase n=1 Tax=Halogranum tailed virus 1 TaxID=1273749 RepID=R4T9C5_9CAUD|nr:ATP-dependent DNA ligase [Halogranum tailed virus 1]AGM11520.1 DNA ligase [Halogranum tailed virus 1]
MTTQSELRDALDYIKNESGSGSKARKQERFVDVYTENVGHIVTGERYDDAGIGKKTAESAVEELYGELDGPTVSESLLDAWGGDIQSLEILVSDLDELAKLSGNEQKEMLVNMLDAHAEPSLVTLALLDDESIGLGTSQMREAFFDGTRDERKHAEAFVETTTEFISLARDEALPTRPIVGRPFDPMLAVPESRGEPDNPIAQRKVDGYRVLIHVKQEELGPRAYAFSRARNDVTASLPELNEIDWPERGEYILDGEVIAENGSYSDTSSRVGRKAENVDRSTEMHFSLFDVVVLNSEYVAERPYSDRYGGLKVFIQEVDSEYVNLLDISEDVEEAKDEAVAAGEEGIIVKDWHAPYEFGKRSTYWQKRKFDAETVDVKIVGFDEATGEKSGTLGAVHIESADGVHVGNSGSGFSDEQRRKIWENQDDWMNRCIEVEARGIGTQGKLRMPIFKRDRSEDGEPDSYDRICEIMKEI